MIPSTVTFAEGGLLTIGILLVWFLLVALALYTRKGSGINRRPSDETDVPADVRSWDRGTR